MSTAKESDVSVEKCGITHLQCNDFTYTWKIENGNVSAKIHKYQKMKLESPLIKFSNLSGRFEFLLQILSPCRKNSESVNDHKVFCQLILISSSENHVNLDVNLSITLSDGTKKQMDSNFEMLSSKNPKLLEESLNAKTFYNCLLNGSVTVSCKFSFYSTKTIYNGKVKVINQPVSQTQSNTSSIEDAYQKLLDSAKFSDVTLMVGRKRFPVHKAILAFRSPVFSAMFEHEMLESKANIVKIPDLEPETMEEVLSFIYAKKVKNINESVSKLLYAADKYQLDDLRLKCEELYIEKLNLNNLEEILNILVKYETCQTLRQAVLEYLSSNAKAITEWESFNRVMMSLPPSFLLETTKAMWSKF